MDRKKFFAAGLVIGLLLYGTAQPAVVQAASPTLSASADTGSIKAGDYVNIHVELGNNPDISTFGAALQYDSSVLQYDSSTWNDDFTESDMQMASDTGSEVNLSVVCDDIYSSDGTVVTVRFQAVQDSDSIPVRLSLRDMADADLAEVADCTVASAVSAPQSSQTPQEPDNSDLVDTDNPDEISDISIIDEEAQPDGQQDDVPDTGNNTGASAGQSVNTSGAQSSSVSSTGASRPDANYKTGIGLGSDLLLVGAAAFGILALFFGIRRGRK